MLWLEPCHSFEGFVCYPCDVVLFCILPTVFQISHYTSSNATIIVKLLKWKTFGLNRLCRSVRNIPVVAFGAEENHKISQWLQPVLWPRCEPRTFLTKTHSCTFKLTCSVQLAVSVRFSLSTCFNRARKYRFRYRCPEVTIYYISWSLFNVFRFSFYLCLLQNDLLP